MRVWENSHLKRDHFSFLIGNIHGITWTWFHHKSLVKMSKIVFWILSPFSSPSILSLKRHPCRTFEWEELRYTLKKMKCAPCLVSPALPHPSPPPPPPATSPSCRRTWGLRSRSATSWRASASASASSASSSSSASAAPRPATSSSSTSSAWSPWRSPFTPRPSRCGKRRAGRSSSWWRPTAASSGVRRHSKTPTRWVALWVAPWLSGWRGLFPPGCCS